MEYEARSWFAQPENPEHPVINVIAPDIETAKRTVFNYASREGLQNYTIFYIKELCPLIHSIALPGITYNFDQRKCDWKNLQYEWGFMKGGQP